MLTRLRVWLYVALLVPTVAAASEATVRQWAQAPLLTGAGWSPPESRLSCSRAFRGDVCARALHEQNGQ